MQVVWNCGEGCIVYVEPTIEVRVFVEAAARAVDLVVVLGVAEMDLIVGYADNWAYERNFNFVFKA